MTLGESWEFFGARELRKFENAIAIEDFEYSETFPLSRACEARFYGGKGQKLRESAREIASFYGVWGFCKREGRKNEECKKQQTV